MGPESSASAKVGCLVARVAHFALDPKNRERKLILIGFTDATGKVKNELAASKQRAQVVGEKLAAAKVPVETVLGMGAILPVAPNDTDDGRARNRRVEVWLR